MIVMVSNNCGYEAGELAGEFCGMLGHLYGPTGKRGPFRCTPWAGDNDSFGFKNRNVEWPEAPWIAFLEWAVRAAQRGYPPRWMLVPDEPYDRERTLEKWGRYVGEVVSRGFRPAFAVQDGMTFDDVPTKDCMLFLGGSTAWKRAAIAPWCARFPDRVHVGRVTEGDRLEHSRDAGAVSVDGNYWFMKTNKPGSRPQREVLIEFLESQRRERKAA